jgi:ADP-ribose pyrophosphatase YjhB (NUDIX family)
MSPSRTRPPLARFCPHCGTPLVPQDDHGVHRPTCAACGFIAYQNPAPAVGVILEKKGSIVLVRRRYEPQVGLWGLPAGFMEYGEAPEETALREAFEETGLRIEVDRLHGAYRGGGPSGPRIVLLVYRARIVGGRLRPGDDADEVGWFELTKLPELAFRSHDRALREYHRDLRRAASTTPARAARTRTDTSGR